MLGQTARDSRGLSVDRKSWHPKIMSQTFEVPGQEQGWSLLIQNLIRLMQTLQGFRRINKVVSPAWSSQDPDLCPVEASPGTYSKERSITLCCISWQGIFRSFCPDTCLPIQSPLSIY